MQRREFVGTAAIALLGACAKADLALSELETMSPDQLVENRYEKFRRIGEFLEVGS